jgi:hypothetical protein
LAVLGSVITQPLKARVFKIFADLDLACDSLCAGATSPYRKLTLITFARGKTKQTRYSFLPSESSPTAMPLDVNDFLSKCDRIIHGQFVEEWDKD